MIYANGKPVTIVADCGRHALEPASVALVKIEFADGRRSFAAAHLLSEDALGEIQSAIKSAPQENLNADDVERAFLEAM